MIAAFTRFDLGNLLAAPARILALLAFVVVAGLLGPLPLLAIAAAAAVTSLGVGTPFLNDERGRLDVLYATLPISRATIVVGRYLEMGIWFVTAAVVGTVTAVVTTLAQGKTVDAHALLLVLALTFCGTALALAVQLPIFFAVGFAKARTAMFAPVFVVAGLVSLAVALGIDTSSFVQAASSPFAPVVLVVIGAVAIVISAFVAIRIYARRQF